MSFLRTTLAACAAAAIVAAPASAKPENPNAAQTSSGQGCLVRDADGAYHFDATCEWHLVVKRDKNGTLTNFSYQDHGQLPEGAPHPKTAIRNSGPWPACGADINEVTSPSGEYRSDCRFKP